MRHILRFTDSNFNQEIESSKLPVLVEFWASWCLPCQMMGLMLEALAEELKDAVKIAKINVDQNLKVREQFNIGGLPTFAVFNSGQELLRKIGAQSKDQLINMLKEAEVLV